MNPKSYGEKCKCGHFESDHVNLNKKFYEPNAIPQMGGGGGGHACLLLQLTITRPLNAEDVHVTSLVRKIKAGYFGNDN